MVQVLTHSREKLRFVEQQNGGNALIDVFVFLNRLQKLELSSRESINPLIKSVL